MEPGLVSTFDTVIRPDRKVIEGALGPEPPWTPPLNAALPGMG